MNDEFRMFQKEDVMPYMSGMWREALQVICGLRDEVFNKKHQPCPHCGGKDRFRWTDKVDSTGDGGAICSNCGNTDGIGWLQKLTGESYSECVNILGRFLGKVPQEYVVKANKKAHRDSGYRFGAQADHEACKAVLDRTESRPVTPLSMYEGIYAESYKVGVKSMLDGSERLFHTIPCAMVHKDGVDDEFCNLLIIDDDGNQSFYAKDYTRGSVCVTGNTDKAIYLCVDWIDAQHVAMTTSQEVWACFTPSNLEIVAHRYKGDRELRVACKASDKETLYMADDADLKVLIPNDDIFKRGMQRKLYKASSLI